MRGILVIGVLWTATPLSAETPFDNWQVFPGPNPEAVDIVSNWEGGPTFRIGHVIFAYDSAWHWPEKERAAVGDLPPIAEMVRAAQPSTGLQGLVSSQLGKDHEFHLERVTLDALGSDAEGWWIEWYLFPATGGSSGVPFRYLAAVTAKSRVLHPDCYVFDAYYQFDVQKWLGSTLKLADNGLPADTETAQGEEIGEADARRIALETLADFSRRRAAEDNDKSLQMRLADVQKVQIPWPTNDDDPPETQSIWAVNFTSDPPTEADRDGYRFTIWVSASGRKSELKVLDVWPSGASELSDAPED